MSSIKSSQKPHLHVAVAPNAGMGHLTPFLQLASMLLSRGLMVTLVTAESTVSLAESNYLAHFLKTHQEIKHVEFEVISFHSSNSTIDDVFFLQYDNISRSTHLLKPLLSSSSPPLSAIYCDLSLAAGVANIAADLTIPFYVLFVSSAKFACLSLHLPSLLSKPDILSSEPTDQVEIPGLTRLPISSIPLPLLNPNRILSQLVLSGVGVLSEAKGILINSFDWFEAETFAALNNGSVVSNLPPFLPVGPLKSHEPERDQSQCLPWLDNQPAESVIYVSFGSRNALSSDQIRELRDGLVKSGFRFLWILKTHIVDKDDKQDLKDLLGDSFFIRTKERGLVVRNWVNQQEILAHPAIGGFVSHCGWNSVLEAAYQGVPVLAWPQGGDQMINAEVVQKAGLGILEKNWGMGFKRLVKEEEIASKIVQVMEDAELRSRAKRVGEEARKATEFGGNSEKAIGRVIEQLG
uniref:Glycosyltransferase n=1 Tax=Rhizophora mucronata TaxID=61149 RepID=A0A2P2IW33_RHIMU